jgi:hypothetical protein
VVDSEWTCCDNELKQGVKWIAFNCPDYSIEPVISGYLVTLTFNIYSSKRLPTTLSPDEEPIYKLLKELISTNKIESMFYKVSFRHFRLN